MTETINIIGAGIGGLTTAITLKQKGLDVNVYEGSAEIKPVGAGIIIANNGMQVFQKLGIQDKIGKAGKKISCLKITDAQLHNISSVDLTEYEKKYGVHNIAIHRGELQKILVEELGYENIRLSKRLAKIEKGDFFKLTFEDKTTTECKIVIGADGIKSVVRKQLFGESKLRNANQLCWRGICEIELPQHKYYDELNEAWGKGKRFGFVRISDKKVYWYALCTPKKLNPKEIVLTELFKEFHSNIINIISATNRDEIILSDIIDLKPIDKWQSDNVCLIGDAAHATTPNLGQGACQAIEDAYVLGKLIDNGIAIEDAFKDYETLRRKKTNAIVNASWMIGKVAHIENDCGIWLRNIVMKNIPKLIRKRQMDMVFNLI